MVGRAGATLSGVMMEQEHFNGEVRRWALEQTKLHVAYLKYIQSRGYVVSEEKLARFQREIRQEEKDLSGSENEMIGERVVAELQLELALVDLDFDATTKYTKATLLRRGYTRLTMQPDKNHQRPHFHIEFKTEYSASYAVDTLSRLAGHMPRKYEAPVLKWGARYRRSLAATWKSLKNGEDVRELVIVLEER